MTKLDQIELGLSRAADLLADQLHVSTKEMLEDWGKAREIREALRLIAEMKADCVVVPREPSIEMIKAAWKAQYIFVGGSDVDAEQLAERRISDVRQLQQDKAAFKAMIQAYESEQKGEKI